jgi:hypothetical protein
MDMKGEHMTGEHPATTNYGERYGGDLSHPHAAFPGLHKVS